MKKRTLIVAAMLSAATLAVSACGSSDGGSGGGGAGGGSTQMSAPLSGQLGDKSLFDSADAGFKQAEQKYGVKIKVVEAAADDAPAWERNLTEASSTGQNKLIITGGTVMASTLKKVAAQFPDQKYLIFDSASENPNVTGIQYAQNEGAFLVGALAALVTKNPTEFPRAKGSNRIGLVGGMDIPVIRDFAAGYEQGAKSIDPSIKVDVRFVGDFQDAQGAYDLTSAMYNDGADVVYQVAGAAGLGVLQAGEEKGRYSIGTDSDQNALQPSSVVASALKNVGNTVRDAVGQFQAGKLQPGTTSTGNIANDGVGIAFNDKLVPADIQKQVDALRQKVISGEIKVDSVL